MKKRYGLDYGTTNSTLSVVDESGTSKILSIDPNAENPFVMRSVIYVSPKHEYLFGDDAVKAYLSDIKENKASHKESFSTGKKLKLANEASATTGFRPDKIVDEIIEIEVSGNGRLFQALKSGLTNKFLSHIRVFERVVPIENIVGAFLKEMKERADMIVGQSVDSVVIGRPVEYVGGNNKLAIEKMTRALKYAGFTNITFQYEPVGAALSYGLTEDTQQTVLVFDFGGGTLDLSVFKLPEIEILATVGLPLGGDYINSTIFTEKIAEFFASKNTYGDKKIPLPSHIFDYLKNWYQISLLKTQAFKDSLENFSYKASNPGAIKALGSLVNNNLGFRLYDSIDQLKIDLSSVGKKEFNFTDKDIDVAFSIERKEFEELMKKDLLDIEKLIDKALTQAGISQIAITQVVTTGGSSLIPKVKELLINRFGKEKLYNQDVFTSVAHGLAVKA